MRLCLFLAVAVAMAAVDMDAVAGAPVGSGERGGGAKLAGFGGP